MTSSGSPNPAFNYRLTHHVLNPFDLSTTGHTIEFGNFATFSDAHEAAQVAINSAILKLMAFGFMDFSTQYRNTTEWTRELVTVSKVDGKEGVLSRFVVERVKTGVDVAVEAPERAVVVRLPPAYPELEVGGGYGGSGYSRGTLYVEERAPGWTQTKVPCLRRRDESSFCGVSVESYGQGVGRRMVDREQSRTWKEQEDGSGEEQDQQHYGNNECSGSIGHLIETRDEGSGQYEDHEKGWQLHSP
jgi:hypothetical protein